MTTLRYVVIVIVSLIIGSFIGWLFGNSNSSSLSIRDSAQLSDDSPPFMTTDTTTITVTDKHNDDDPDLVIDNKYIAKVDGQELVIPEKKVDTNDQILTVTHKVDMTPVVNYIAETQYDRDWSVGLGIGHDTDEGLYVPVSVERHFNKDRSVEMVMGLNTDNGSIHNVSLLYKYHW